MTNLLDYTAFMSVTSIRNHFERDHERVDGLFQKEP
jgi:hypothetical protein